MTASPRDAEPRKPAGPKRAPEAQREGDDQEPIEVWRDLVVDTGLVGCLRTEVANVVAGRATRSGGEGRTSQLRVRARAREDEVGVSGGRPDTRPYPEKTFRGWVGVSWERGDGLGAGPTEAV